MLDLQEKKRVERGNSSDSLLSTESESARDRVPYDPALQHLLKAHTGGELTDDIVDAIVKSPIKV